MDTEGYEGRRYSLASVWSLCEVKTDCMFAVLGSWHNASDCCCGYGFVNSQDENPCILHETPLHDEKVGVWCALSQHCIVGLIFFHTTVATAVYVEIFHGFVTKLDDKELCTDYFQQHGATCHTSNVSMVEIVSLFEDCVISKGLCPSGSPYLTPLDLFLWGMMEGKVYSRKPWMRMELQGKIWWEIEAVTPDVLVNTFNNMDRLVQACLDANGTYVMCFHTGMVSGYVWDKGTERERYATDDEFNRINQDIEDEFKKDGGKIQYVHQDINMGVQSDQVVDKLPGNDVFTYPCKRSDKVKTLASKERVNIGDNEHISVDLTLLFQRLIVATSHGQVNLQVALQYQLCA
uniref:Uncharacterized protein n=1 Tax=Timema monikensis TaxID=170555 RepID=A0A7R9DZX8_9NEOP|nr:unnamed protein product [Timema monikensis]